MCVLSKARWRGKESERRSEREPAGAAWSRRSAPLPLPFALAAAGTNAAGTLAPAGTFSSARSCMYSYIYSTQQQEGCDRSHRRHDLLQRVGHDLGRRPAGHAARAKGERAAAEPLLLLLSARRLAGGRGGAGCGVGRVWVDWWGGEQKQHAALFAAMRHAAAAGGSAARMRRALAWRRSGTLLTPRLTPAPLLCLLRASLAATQW